MGRVTLYEGSRAVIHLNDREAYVLFDVESREGVHRFSLRGFFIRRHLISLGLLELNPQSNLHCITRLGRAYMKQIHQKLSDDDLGLDSLG